MDNKGEIGQVFNNNPQGGRQRGRSKNRCWNCVQTEINKFTIKKMENRLKTDLTGRSPLRRRRSALECSAI
jgi:hypothetical protein